MTKINVSRKAINVVSDKISQLFNINTKQELFKKIPRYNNLFNSWPLMPKLGLSARAGYNIGPKLNMEALARFLATHQEKTKMPTLLDSSLDRHWLGFSLHQDALVKDMASLVLESLAEMKRVELIHSGSKKG